MKTTIPAGRQRNLYSACRAIGVLSACVSLTSTLWAASYEYDVKDQVASAVLPNGQNLAYSYDNAGNLTGIAVTVASAPAAPQPSAQTLASGITIAWTPVAGSAVYDIWRNTSPEPPNLLRRSPGAIQVAANVWTTSWTDPTAEPGVTYYYWVQGKNGAGSGPLSEVIMALYEKADITAIYLLLSP